MDKEAANAAALALRHLCDACGAAMVPHLDALMALYQRIQSAGQATTSAAAPPAHAAVEEANVQQVSSPYQTITALLPARYRNPKAYSNAGQYVVDVLDRGVCAMLVSLIASQLRAPYLLMPGK